MNRKTPLVIAALGLLALSLTIGATLFRSEKTVETAPQKTTKPTPTKKAEPKTNDAAAPKTTRKALGVQVESKTVAKVEIATGKAEGKSFALITTIAQEGHYLNEDYPWTLSIKKTGTCSVKKVDVTW